MYLQYMCFIVFHGFIFMVVDHFAHEHVADVALAHPQALSSRSSYLSLKAVAVPPERHEMQPFRTKWTLDVQNLSKIAILKRPAQLFRTKWTLDVKN